VAGVEDHVHALFALSRTHAPANVIKEIKRTSSSCVKQTYPKFSQFHWQAGYVAFSVSQSKLDTVTTYIANQEEHHKRITFQDEYRAFLEAHAVEYDDVTFGTKRRKTLSGLNIRGCMIPGLKQPWARISQRLRRSIKPTARFSAPREVQRLSHTELQQCLENYFEPIRLQLLRELTKGTCLLDDEGNRCVNQRRERVFWTTRKSLR
jgi:transposase IS200 family protein